MLKKREERNNKAFQKFIKKNNKSKQELKDRIQEKKVQQV